MIGSIIADVIGSVYEFENTKKEDFELFSEGSTFTDDTLLTVATAVAILDNTNYRDEYIKFSKIATF